MLNAKSGEVVRGCTLSLTTWYCVSVVMCVCWMFRKWSMLNAKSGEVVRGWPVQIARPLRTAPLVTRLYPLDMTLLVSTLLITSDGNN